MIKYKEWSEILIKPQALNDSRLFVLERRIIEEEELRIKEFIILQENMKKLIYTIEQDEQIKLKNTEAFTNVDIKFPTIRSPRNGMDPSELSKSVDFGSK